jgi:hypothetical protein
MIWSRYQGLTAGEKDRIPHRLRVGCDHDRTAIGLDRAPPDMDDHRLARDIRHRLIGQPRRFQPCRNDDQAVHDRREVARDRVQRDNGRDADVRVATSAYAL